MGIAAAIIGAFVSTAVGGTFAVAGFFGTFLGTFLVRAAIGIALNALTPKPKTQGTNRGYQVTTRGSALDHQIIYGRMRVGGVVVFDKTTGVNNRYLHRVIAFSGHEIESFDEIYINDEVVTLDSNGFVTSPTKYNQIIRINEHLGSPDQLADQDLVDETAGLPEEEDKWTNEHRLRGISYLYIRMDFNQNAFPNGVPDITATIKGKKVYDPRTDTTAWSDNPALCLRDYLTEGYGLNEATANIDDDLVITTANVCDQTDTLNSEKRYTCNGAFVTQITPFDILNDLLTSMGGLLWYSQGQWRMKPAYYVAPTVSFNEDDLRSSISVKTRQSRRDNYNTVRGTFRGEESNWQVTDYPEVTNIVFVDADNGQESVIDLDLPFTDNAEEARRIARISLERNRQQLTVSAAFGLRAFQVQTGDIVQLSVERFGWTNKEFEVTAWTFGLVEGQDLQVQMTLREISESVFDEVDDGEVYERDNTTLPSPFDVPTLGIPTGDIVTTIRIVREKITEVISINVSTARSAEVDYIEVQYKERGAADWIGLGSGPLGRYELVDPEPGSYVFRARAINTFGVKGDWTESSGVQTAGSAEPPSDVDNLFYEINEKTTTLEWDAVSDLDLSYYRVRHAVETTGATWANSTTAVDKVPRPGTSVALPSRPGSYMIKAYDKTGLASLTETIVVVNPDDLPSYTNTLTQAEHSTFSGTKTGCELSGSNLIITLGSSAPHEATYDFSTYIETHDSTARRVRARVDAAVTRVDESAGLWDDLPGLFDDLPGLFDDFTGGAGFADTNILFYISTTEDDPAGSPTWSAYKLFRAGDFYGRGFRFRIVMKSSADTVTPSISALTAVVEY
jgi:hypothetical protein